MALLLIGFDPACDTLPGNPLEQARLTFARKLLFFNQRRATHTVVLGPEGLDVDLLTDFAISHPEVPTSDGGGAKASNWSRRPMRAQSIEFDPETLEVTIHAADLRWRQHTYWESGVPTAPDLSSATDAVGDGDGASFPTSNASRRAWRGFSRGGHRATYARAIDGRAQFTYYDYEKLDGNGLLVESADTNQLLRSSFVSGLTGLTATPGTAGTITVSSALSFSRVLFDTAITASFITFKAGTAGANNLKWPATAAIGGAGITGWLSIDHRDHSAITNLAYRLQRTSDSKYLQGDGTWGVAATINNLTNHVELWREWIKVDLSVSTTYTLEIIQPAGITAGEFSDLHHVQLSDKAYGLSSRVVTDSVVLSRNQEYLYVGNGLGNRVVNNAPWTFFGYFAPLWKGTDVANGKKFTVWEVDYDANNRWALYWDSTTDALTLECVAGGVTTTASVPWSPDPVQASGVQMLGLNAWYRIAARATSSAGELGNAFTLSVWVNGVKGTDGVAAASPTATSSSRLYLNSTPQAGREPGNGYLKRDQFFPVAFTDAEVQAWA